MQLSCERGSLVYKIVRHDEWGAAQRTGAYHGSADDQRDGFIHLSAAHQLQGTAQKHFRGQSGLVLVGFRTDDLGEALRWETSRGNDLFPHLYGPLRTELAVETYELQLGEDGVPILPEIATL